MLKSAIATALLLAAGGACAEPQQTALVAPGWIAGHWRSEVNGAVSEEFWTDGAGGTYFAVSRSINNGSLAAFEFLRIETDGGIALVAQPQGRPPTRFAAVAAEANRIRFYTADNDYPNYVEYVRDGDAMSARIWSAEDEGDAMSFNWTLIAR